MLNINNGSGSIATAVAKKKSKYKVNEREKLCVQDSRDKCWLWLPDNSIVKVSGAREKIDLIVE